MSLFTGYESENENKTKGNFLPKSGGKMSGNIDMGIYKISTISNPISDKDLARKKYVDDKVSEVKGSGNLSGTSAGNFLPKTRGKMLGDINMDIFRIKTISNPISDKDLARKNILTII